jgi:hypothetical protein
MCQLQRQVCSGCHFVNQEVGRLRLLARGKHEATGPPQLCMQERRLLVRLSRRQAPGQRCRTLVRVVLVIFTGTVYRPVRSMGASTFTPEVVTGAPVMTLAVTTGGDGVAALT